MDKIYIAILALIVLLYVTYNELTSLGNITYAATVSGARNAGTALTR